MAALDFRILNSRGPHRAIALSHRQHALVFRCAEKDSAVTLELISADKLDLTQDYTPRKQVHGCLGLLNINNEIWLGIVDGAAPVGSLVRDESISRVISVAFYSLSTSFYDNANSSGGPSTFETASSNPELLEHPCSAVAKIFSNGNFYFSSDFDLSSRLELRAARGNNDAGLYDTRFLWNSFMLDSQLAFRANLTASERANFDAGRFLTMLTQGYCGCYDVNMGGVSGQASVSISVISRLGWHRAGTRFNMRGIDDRGHVANFVETETILRTHDFCFSYVQVRGSVPLFWEQQGVQPFATKMQITRPQVASQPAFDKHMTSLLQSYPKVHIMNLLGSKTDEELLTSSYLSHLNSAAMTNESIASNTSLTSFDFHARTRIVGLEAMQDQLMQEPPVHDALSSFGYTLVTVDPQSQTQGHLITKQEGVFRTNCLDCLDRTNVIQDVVSRMVLTDFLRNTHPEWASSDQLWGLHRTLWAENGDSLAKIYAGTGALNTSFTRSGKKTLAGVLSNATKSVGRMYQSNFLDPGKQQAIDQLLGNLNGQQKVVVFDPVHDAVHQALESRASEYSSYSNSTILVGTFNLNGKPPGSESLLPWLVPQASTEPDFIVLGFQEIVQLNAGQIINADPAKKRAWESAVYQTLARRPDAKAEYVLLRSEQLVGAALMVIVKTSMIADIKNVEAATRKTGLKGMAGNKGGIGIRLEYKDSSFCFLTAHFAAGSSNVDERNNDYWTISDGLTFRRGLGIHSHDNIVWAGDFNYRVSLPTADARRIATSDDFDSLLSEDQLSLALMAKECFVGYTEAPITFRPTYKYDPSSDVYDSSEKQRVPSWTDRILVKGIDLDISRYARAEIRLSDHRPVYAILRARVKTINAKAKDTLSNQILRQVQAIGVNGLQSKHLVKPAVQDRPNVQYPPPSDDTQNWWTTPDNPDGTVTDESLWTTPTSGNPFDTPIKNGIARIPPPVPSKAGIM